MLAGAACPLLGCGTLPPFAAAAGAGEHGACMHALVGVAQRAGGCVHAAGLVAECVSVCSACT